MHFSALNLPAADDPTDQVDYFANNGFGNAVAIVQQPAGEHHNGVTYVAYQGPLEDPYVAAYHHETGEWQGPFKAGESVMGKAPDRPKPIDNHGKPALVIDDEGYLHLAFGGHGGMPHHGKNPLGNIHYGEMRHVVSKRPLDISSWELLDNVSVFGTYNQWVKMDNGDLYLFYRHGAHRSDWVYQKSTDNGRTFAPPVSFLKHRRRSDVAAVDSWYPWVGRGEGDDIIVVYDYHLCWDVDSGRRGHGHTTERRNAYYMVMDTKSGVWRNVQGETLSMPIVKDYADEKTLAVTTGDLLWTFNGAAKLDPASHPHFTTSIGPMDWSKFGGSKLTTHFRWTGQEWSGNLATGMPRGGGDMLISSSEDVRIFLGGRDAGNDGSVAIWRSKDGGDSFIREKVLLHRPGSGMAISSMIKNAHPDARVIAAEIPSGTDYRRMYLIGDNGPIPRAKRAASVLVRVE
ncbi:MAG: hypothetical protein SynsKO_42200 [Synoicihabitans sp.]